MKKQPKDYKKHSLIQTGAIKNNKVDLGKIGQLTHSESGTLTICTQPRVWFVLLLTHMVLQY